ncbi:prepilin-type N-terminal cleavage/methylation domain-containing protein [Limnobacter humi]|uniref:Prepilin-type N-terminal cleavage/methylation domain-containing protein n=1 Tax=Limnobacter humi TaxID=1778671 RepID=A0ABT1WJV5_9BURK|nr:prepilin-type N-terminal cleavage/methylation domain-containing protein [Limnobacter humi]MCQ8897321.1 prepilin-type N-terminal cleavage/methylation domain-containing protein [Limnobacter humi]
MNVKHTHGFTILELMIALAIVGVVATIALSGVDVFNRHRMRVEASSLLRQVAMNQISYRDRYGVYGTLSSLQSAGLASNSDYFDLQLDVPAVTAFRQYSLTLTARNPGYDETCQVYRMVVDGGITSTTSQDSSNADSTRRCL